MMMPELDKISSPFHGLNPVALRALEEAATELNLNQGDSVFREGEPGDAVFMVVSGVLEVAAETSAGRYRLETIGEGGWVGETSLIKSGPRLNSAFALTTSRILRVPADICRSFIATDPNAERQLMDAVLRRLPSHHLRSMALFAGMDSHSLTKLDHLVGWVCVPGGEILCRQGDPTDAVFIVIDGSLETLIETEGAERLVNILERGAAIGEVGVLSGETRSATIRAARDSNLIRIEREHFLQLLNEHPQIAVNFARLLANRLRQLTLTPRLTPTVRTVAIISANSSLVPGGFVDDLVSAFGRLRRHTRRISSRDVDSELGPGVASAMPNTDAQRRLSNWLDVLQATHPVIIYECDPKVSAWTLRALRQSDLILMIGRGDDRPQAGPLDEALAQSGNLARMRRELVLLHEGSPPKGTDRWLEFRSPAKHHHLRIGYAADFDRLARSVIGASIGVALSGGAARGFAHIGLLKALQEHGIPVDVIGGTSMGSLIAAQMAMGWDIATMIERNRKAFVECAVFSDLTFPYIALMKGKSTASLLREMFGDIQIEDLWLPYFCVSTNLSRAQLVVHERGPVWLWVRSSSSVPAVGPPIPWNGDLLVDGGLLNNLPVDILRARCAGPLIASDVSPSVDLRTDVETSAEMSGWPYLGRALSLWSKPPNFPSLFEILLRCTGMSSDQSLAQTKRTADVYLHPDLSTIRSLDWAAIDRAVEIGYRYACERLDDWQHATTGAASNSRIEKC